MWHCPCQAWNEPLTSSPLLSRVDRWDTTAACHVVNHEGRVQETRLDSTVPQWHRSNVDGNSRQVDWTTIYQLRKIEKHQYKQSHYISGQQIIQNNHSNSVLQTKDTPLYQLHKINTTVMPTNKQNCTYHTMCDPPLPHPLHLSDEYLSYTVTCKCWGRKDSSPIDW